jgi:hypothetical protein
MGEPWRATKTLKTTTIGSRRPASATREDRAPGRCKPNPLISVGAPSIRGEHDVRWEVRLPTIGAPARHRCRHVRQARRCRRARRCRGKPRASSKRERCLGRPSSALPAMARGHDIAAPSVQAKTIRAQRFRTVRIRQPRPRPRTPKVGVVAEGGTYRLLDVSQRPSLRIHVFGASREGGRRLELLVSQQLTRAIANAKNQRARAGRTKVWLRPSANHGHRRVALRNIAAKNWRADPAAMRSRLASTRSGTGRGAWGIG